MFSTRETLYTDIPIWCRYHALSRGAGLVYSSVKTFKKDLTKHRPHILVAVSKYFSSSFLLSILEVSDTQVYEP